MKEKGGIYKLSSSILKFVMKEEEDFLDYDEEAVTKDEKVSKKVEQGHQKRNSSNKKPRKKRSVKKEKIICQIPRRNRLQKHHHSQEPALHRIWPKKLQQFMKWNIVSN